MNTVNHRIPLGIVGLVLLVGYSPYCAGRTQVSEASQSFVDARVMAMLLELLKKDSDVAILRFEPAFSLDEFGKRNGSPLSGIQFDLSDKTYLHVEGVFSLIRKLAGDPPKLGQVKESFPFSSIRRPDWDERFRRINPVFTHYPFDPKKDSSVLILAVWGKKPTNVLDGTFFGPLGKEDPAYLSAVADLLSKNPYSELTKEHAEKLLESENPWLVYLALARLQTLKSLTVHQYARSIKVMPGANMRPATRDFLSWVMRNRKEKEATREIVALFGNLDPERERTILSTLNHAFRINPHLIESYVVLPNLQNAAKAYRAKILDDPARREVVRQLELLIELRAKK